MCCTLEIVQWLSLHSHSCGEVKTDCRELAHFWFLYLVGPENLHFYRFQVGVMLLVWELLGTCFHFDA